MNKNLFADKRINYKDFLIIIISWYFIIFGNTVLKEVEFAGLLYINKLLAFSFNVLGHIIFISVIYIYFNFLYSTSLKDLGLKFERENNNFIITAAAVLLLTFGVILINLNPAELGNSFSPLYRINNFSEVMSALPFLVIIAAAAFITALVEQFLFNKIIFSIFNLYLPKFLAALFTALIAPILMLQFNPAFMLIIFTAVLISCFIYISSSFNLTAPVIFYASFLTLYTAFIYGFNFMII